MIIGLVLRQQCRTGWRSRLNQSREDLSLAFGINLAKPWRGHKPFARRDIDHLSAS